MDTLPSSDWKKGALSSRWDIVPRTTGQTVRGYSKNSLGGCGILMVLNKFWQRWRRECILHREAVSPAVGDVVLINDDKLTETRTSRRYHCWPRQTTSYRLARASVLQARDWIRGAQFKTKTDHVNWPFRPRWKGCWTIREWLRPRSGCKLFRVVWGRWGWTYQRCMASFLAQTAKFSSIT